MNTHLPLFSYSNWNKIPTKPWHFCKALIYHLILKFIQKNNYFVVTTSLPPKRMIIIYGLFLPTNTVNNCKICRVLRSLRNSVLFEVSNKRSVLLKLNLEMTQEKKETKWHDNNWVAINITTIVMYNCIDMYTESSKPIKYLSTAIQIC